MAIKPLPMLREASNIVKFEKSSRFLTQGVTIHVYEPSAPAYGRG